MLSYTMLYYTILYTLLLVASSAWFRRGDDTVGDPHRARSYQFDILRAYYPTETRHKLPCRAIPGNSISVNSTSPPLKSVVDLPLPARCEKTQTDAISCRNSDISTVPSPPLIIPEGTKCATPVYVYIYIYIYIALLVYYRRFS